jgi:beta-glucanase (GH16 family)
VPIFTYRAYSFYCASVPMLLLYTLLSIAFSAAQGGYCDQPGWDTVFLDTFDTLDSTSWTALNGTSENDSSCREAMCLTDNVSIRNGTLVLTAKSQASGWASYTTGAVNSRGKRFWQATSSSPFRACVSGLLPGGGGTGQGLWPAFWMMPNDASCWPTHGEMDILEMINGDGIVHATYHVAQNSTSCGKDEDDGGSMPIPDFDRNFHEYAVQRSQHSLQFVYDGVVVYDSQHGKKNLTVLDVPWYM